MCQAHAGTRHLSTYLSTLPVSFMSTLMSRLELRGTMIVITRSMSTRASGLTWNNSGTSPPMHTWMTRHNTSSSPISYVGTWNYVITPSLTWADGTTSSPHLLHRHMELRHHHLLHGHMELCHHPISFTGICNYGITHILQEHMELHHQLSLTGAHGTTLSTIPYRGTWNYIINCLLQGHMELHHQLSLTGGTWNYVITPYLSRAYATMPSPHLLQEHMELHHQLSLTGAHGTTLSTIPYRGTWNYIINCLLQGHMELHHQLSLTGAHGTMSSPHIIVPCAPCKR